MKKSILIEGLDGVGKTTIVQLLAARLNAQIIKTPPAAILPFREWFVHDTPHEQDSEEQRQIHGGNMREAYYMLGNAMSSRAMADMTTLQQNHVVMDRMYPSTIAYLRGKELSPPPINSDSGPAWPTIIHRPDYMFVLRVNQEVRLKRLRGRDGGILLTEEDNLLAQSQYADRVNEWYVYLGCDPIDIPEEWTPEQVTDEIMRRAGLVGVSDVD